MYTVAAVTCQLAGLSPLFLVWQGWGGSPGRIAACQGHMARSRLPVFLFVSWPSLPGNCQDTVAKKSSFGKVKQPQVTCANICVFFWVLLCSAWRKVYGWTCREWNLGVTLDHLDEAVEPKESLGWSGYDVSSRILFKALGSVIEFRMVQCGFGLSLLFRIHYTRPFWLKLAPHASRGREREKSRDWSWLKSCIFCLLF